MKNRTATLGLCLLALALGVLLALGPSAQAATYYVSPGGSDSASGRTPAHAWQTVEEVNRSHLRPGDRVLFRGDSSFFDDALMPGWGVDASGTPEHPIEFGSYGQGHARLVKGIWIKNEHDLVFGDLLLGPEQGISGTGQRVTLRDCDMRGFLHGVEIPVDVIGSHWTITGNFIERTGDSGMLLRGDHFRVTGNVIRDTGLDPAVTYGAHGIYLKAPDSEVIGNRIIGFHNDGVSVRYRNSLVEDNLIENGDIGLAWFQYDSIAGHSVWRHNTIRDIHVAAIYVSPSDIGGRTRESFTITGNLIAQAGKAVSGSSGGWQALSLSQTSGHYVVLGNSVGG